MGEPTPPPLGYGQLDDQTLDEVTPRLYAFVADLIMSLRRANLEVETTQAYLLNSTHHPIEVPCSIQGIPIQVSFEAVLPKWSDEPVARICYSVNHGKRFFKTESKVDRVIPFNFVLRRILREVVVEVQQRKDEERAQRHQQHAKNALRDLGDKLGITPSEGKLSRGNLLIQTLPQSHTLVAISLTVTHEQAHEIAEKYSNVT